MSTPDERLQPLLAALQRSRLSGLAAQALARLEAAEQSRLSGEDEDDPFAPPNEENPDRRALRQLKLLDTFVAGRVRLELKLFERSLERLQQLGDARGAFPLAILVTAEPQEGEDRLDPGKFDPLDIDRMDKTHRFLTAWKKAVAATRATLGEGGSIG